MVMLSPRRTLWAASHSLGPSLCITTSSVADAAAASATSQGGILIVALQARCLTPDYSSGFRRLRILTRWRSNTHNQPDPATRAPGHVTKKRLRETSECPKTGNSQTRLFPLQFVVRPSRDAETAKSPPLHAGSAHEQSRAEVPSKYVPSTRGVSHTMARSEKPSEVPSCRAAVRYDSR